MPRIVSLRFAEESAPGLAVPHISTYFEMISSTGERVGGLIEKKLFLEIVERVNLSNIVMTQLESLHNEVGHHGHYA